MKISAKIATLAVLSMSALSGCIKDKGESSDRPVSFESSIAAPDIELNTGGKISTRASGTVWHADDVIGVYMIEADGTVADNSLETNAMHDHAGEGRFVACSGHELFYPGTGSVDFVAYHPWRPSHSDHLYPIDVTDQCVPSAIDLLYSDNATGHSAGEVPTLQFRHVLSKLVFDIKNATGAPLDGTKAVITGLKTRGFFHLSDKTLVPAGDSAANIAPAGVDDGDSDRATARFEAIVLPGPALSPVVAFTFDGGATARLNLSGVTYTGGKTYIYEVSVTASGEVVLDGGATIVDWDDRDSRPGEHHVPKTDPGGPDDPSKQKQQYYFETFGGGDIETPVKIADYKGWAYPQVKFADSRGGADIRSHSSLGAHIYFPPGKNADLKITGLPTGYTDVTLSYDIASAASGEVGANVIGIYAGEKNMTSEATKTVSSPNSYTRISIDLAEGTTSIRFVSAANVNTTGMRIDNIRLSGNKI